MGLISTPHPTGAAHRFPQGERKAANFTCPKLLRTNICDFTHDELPSTIMANFSDTSSTVTKVYLITVSQSRTIFLYWELFQHYPAWHPARPFNQVVFVVFRRYAIFGNCAPLHRYTRIKHSLPIAGNQRVPFW